MTAGPLAAVVRYETRRRYRAVKGDDQKVLQYGIFGMFGAVGVLVLVGLAYAAGSQAAGGDAGGLLAPVGTAFAVALAAVTGLEAWQAGKHGLLSASPEGVLLGTSHRTVVVGVLLVECLRNLASIGLAGLLAGIAFGAGARSPASVGLIALAVVATVTAGTLLGVVVALAIRTTVARVTLIARLRTPIAAAAFFAYVWLLATGQFSQLVGPVVAAFPGDALVLLAHLPLLGVVPAADPFVAIAVLGAAAGVAGALVPVNAWLAGRLWYETPVRPGGSSYDSAMEGLPWLTGQTSAVVRKAWIRARRSPARLIGYVWPVVFFVEPLLSAVGSGVAPAWLPVAIGLYGVWVTGALFTLNPIGDETPMLPVTLTTPITGRRHVRALWIAGAVVGVPLTLFGTATASALAGYGLVDAVFVSLLAVGLAAVAPALAAGIGAGFPETETTEVLGQVETTQPGFAAFLAYSIGLAVLSVPAWAVAPLPIRAWLAASVGVPDAVVGVAATVLAVVLVGLAGRFSVRAAARYFDSYTVA